VRREIGAGIQRFGARQREVIWDAPNKLKAYFKSTPHPRYSIVSSRIRKSLISTWTFNEELKLCIFESIQIVCKTSCLLAARYVALRFNYGSFW